MYKYGQNTKNPHTLEENQQNERNYQTQQPEKLTSQETVSAQEKEM